MIFKSSGFKLAAAVFIGVIVFILPRPEGTKFKLSGTGADQLSGAVSQYFSTGQTAPGKPVILTAKSPGTKQARAQYLVDQAKKMGLSEVTVD
ncbi:MAG: anion transporter, partial [Desulfobacterales bacterium]|nr:anion transporter [Desulfobacterales bacterium]